jgi:enamine deaminase RidA (YjgF/YER057c/UK114 family)
MHGSTIRFVNPPSLPAPPGYSQVAVVTGGEMIIIAGQVALDAEGALVGAGDFAAQATQAFRNLIAALEAAGAGPRNLVKLTTFVTDISQLAAFRTVRDQFLDPAHRPASTLVQVVQLFRPEFLIEVEALAVR